MIIVEFQHKHILHTHLHIPLCENNLEVIKNQGHILLSRANPEQELKSNFLESLQDTSNVLLPHISVSKSKTSRNLQSLTLLRNCFLLKQFQIISGRMFHEGSSNTKLQWKPAFQAGFVTSTSRILCGPTQRLFQAPSSAKSHWMHSQGPVTQKVLGLPAAKVQTPRSSKVSKILAQFQPGQT